MPDEKKKQEMDDMFGAIHEATRGIPIRERKYYMSMMWDIMKKYGISESVIIREIAIDSVTLSRLYKEYMEMGRAVLEDINKSK